MVYIVVVSLPSELYEEPESLELLPEPLEPLPSWLSDFPEPPYCETAHCRIGRRWAAVPCLRASASAGCCPCHLRRRSARSPRALHRRRPRGRRPETLRRAMPMSYRSTRVRRPSSLSVSGPDRPLLQAPPPPRPFQSAYNGLWPPCAFASGVFAPHTFAPHTFAPCAFMFWPLTACIFPGCGFIACVGAFCAYHAARDPSP